MAVQWRHRPRAAARLRRSLPVAPSPPFPHTHTHTYTSQVSHNAALTSARCTAHVLAAMRTLRTRRVVAAPDFVAAAAEGLPARGGAARYEALALDVDTEDGTVYALCGASDGADGDACVVSFRPADGADDGAGDGASARVVACNGCCGAPLFAVFCADQRALAAGFASGELVLAGADDALAAAVGVADTPAECVGAFSDGLVAGALSPDGDALALLTGGGSLALLDATTLDILAEASLLDGAGASRARLSWRGDGAYLLCAWVPAVEGARTCQAAVFERDGLALHSQLDVGEGARYAPDTPGATAWQPAGTLIAVATRSPTDGGVDGAMELTCFERNGLLRHSAKLPARVRAVSSMAWNADSTLLAATVDVCDGGDGGHEGSCALHVYRRSNAHWYLLHELRGSGGGAADVPRAHWDAERAYTLHLWTATGDYERLELEWAHAISDAGVAAVVDGARALLTPLQHAQVPPPACLLVATAPRGKGVGAIAALAWAPPHSAENDDGERLVAAFSCGRFGVALPPPAHAVDAWERADDDGGIEFVTGGLVMGAGESIRQVAWVGGRPEAGGTGAALGAQTAVDVACITTDLCGGDKVVRVRGPSVAELCMATVVAPSVPLPIDAIAARGGMLAVAAGGAVRVWALERHDASDGCNDTGDCSGALQWEQPASTHGLGGEGAEGRASCSWLALVDTRSAVSGATASDMDGSGGGLFPVSLSSCGVLRCGTRVVDAGVTSACVRAAAHVECGGDGLARLVYVVGQDALGIGVVNVAGDGLRGGAPCMRPAEAGARVVCAPSAASCVVLQMPRGNLETVGPRALTAPRVCALLRAGRWAAAYALARRARVDLNLLLAVRGACPPILCGGAAVLVEQLVAARGQAAAAAGVTDVVGSLRSDWASAARCYEDVLGPGELSLDVLEGHDKDGGRDGTGRGDGGEDKRDGSGGGESAVTAVCTALREALDGLCGTAGDSEEINNSSRARSQSTVESAALTTLVRSQPPRLEEALARIRRLRVAELEKVQSDQAVGRARQAAQLEQHRHTVSSAAMRSLLGLCSITRLNAYDCALGTYDLDLALFVASEDARDPSEYLPRLRALAAMPERARMASIDEELGRHESALANLVAAGGEHAARAPAYALQHELFGAGLRLLPQRSEGLAALLAAYADRASRAGEHEEAACVLSRAGDHSGAAACYAAAGMHVESLCALSRTGMHAPAQLRARAREVVCGLREAGDARGAAEVASQWLSSECELLVEVQCEAHEWRAAAAAAARSERASDLVASTLVPAAAAAAVALLDMTKSATESRAAYLKRLRALRERRAAAAARQAERDAAMAADEEGIGADWDAASEASTVAMSGVTGMTGLSKLSAYTSASAASSVASARSSHRSTIMRGNGSSGRSDGGGGRRRKERSSKKERKAKAGSPHEEASLVRHMKAGVPTPDDRRRWRELCELLVREGHHEDARALQRALGAHAGAAAAAAEEALADMDGAERAKLEAAAAPTWDWKLLEL